MFSYLLTVRLEQINFLIFCFLICILRMNWAALMGKYLSVYNALLTAFVKIKHVVIFTKIPSLLPPYTGIPPSSPVAILSCGVTKAKSLAIG